MRDTARVIFRLGILCTLVVSLWSFMRTGGLSQNSGQLEKQILIIVHPLQPESDRAVVGVSCEVSRPATPDARREFTCVLKNNANKNITAANLAYSISLSNDGGEAQRDKHFLTMETNTILGSQGLSSPLRPGQESTLGPVGIAYPDAAVRGVEVSIDYIEFEDNTILGPNEAGARIIADVRSGAAKYKAWLTKEYVRRGKSVAAIVPLLQPDSPTPDGLGFSSFHEEVGAKQYRNLLRKKYQILGADVIKEHLQK